MLLVLFLHSSGSEVHSERVSGKRSSRSESSGDSGGEAHPHIQKKRNRVKMNRFLNARNRSFAGV